MDYQVSYPAKDTAVITATLPADVWTKYVEEAKAALPEAEASAVTDHAISLAAADVAMEAMEKDHLALATAPVVAGEEKDGTLEMTLNCQLLPEVKLGQYTGYDIEAKANALTEEELMAEIHARLNAEKLWVNVPDGTPAKEGDRVIIDFVGKKDGVAFQGGTAENYPLVLGSKSFIPGFEEALIGAKAGEKVDVNVTFPEDYFEKSLAGAPVVFECTVKEVQEEIKPELSDEFFKKMGIEGVKSVDEFKSKVEAEMKGLKEQEAENAAVLELLTKISEGTDIDIPQAMIDRQVAQHINQLSSQMQQYQMGLEQYLQMTGLNMEELKQQLEPQAILDIRQALILEAIAAKEGIKAEDDEIAAEYNLLSSVYGMPAAQLQMFIPAGAVASQIANKKTIEFLKKENIKKA